MWKIWKKSTKRGLSSIIASGILLSAVAIMGTMVVGWSNSNLSINKSNLENTFSANINKINEEIIIENVWFGGASATKFVNITLYNQGQAGLNVTKIKFVDPYDLSELASFAFTDSGILPKESFSPAGINYDWQSNTPFEIVVTTLRDSVIREQVSP